MAVHPDIIRAQLVGGIGFGLGAVLKSQITIEGGAVQEGNFDGTTCCAGGNPLLAKLRAAYRGG
jgi:hypothetical protein